MSDKTKTGNEGENLAAEFLENKGFQIVARNYRYKHAEIDLIVKRDNWLIFIEVKTRSSNAFGFPEEFVDSTKVSHIFKAAEEYIFSTDWHGNIRFDIVSVNIGRSNTIVHLEDAMN